MAITPGSIESSEPNSYWLGQIDDSPATNVLTYYQVANDLNGNFYSCGQEGTTYAIYQKVNKYGNQLFQKKSQSSLPTTQYQGIALDPTNTYIYMAGFINNGGNPQYGFVSKYDIATMTLQWQRTCGDGTSTGQGHFQDITVDSSGNVYAAGSWQTGIGQYGLIAKWNSAGTFQQSTLFNDSTSTFNNCVYGISCDSSNNIYIICSYNNSSLGYNPIIAKLPSTLLSITWQRKISNNSLAAGSQSDWLSDICIDSSSNVYVCGYSNQSVGQSGVLLKYNTSGTLQWQRKVTDTNSTPGTWLYGISVDPAGNVYTGGYFTSSSISSPALLLKYNSTPTLQWQRSITGPTNATYYGTTIYSTTILGRNTPIFITGYTYNTSQGLSGLLGSLPQDGSQTGTANGLTYAASSVTDASGTLTDSAGAITITTNFTTTTGTGSNTEPNLSLTYTHASI